jgi:aldose 1-epimerase
MITLHAGRSSLVLAPEIGGAIAGWTYGNAPVMRLPDPEAIVAGRSRGLSSFPLVPYSNRIGYARFSFGGEAFELGRNFGDPHALHGVGWTSRWSVPEATDTRATLALAHDPSGAGARKWPFAFLAEQRFSLSQDTLRIEMSIRNTDPRPAPAGLGLHPYFPRFGEVSLQFSAGEVWTNGADHLPDRRVPVPPEWDHTNGRPVGSAKLDNCFADWDGQARISRPGLGVRIEASDIFRHLVVYTPANRPYFAVEPVSHMNDAIHHPEVDDNGLHVLEPGATLRGELLFHVS